MSIILVTGATGYIGGRLYKLLEDKGLDVRCLARNPERLLAKVKPTTQVVKGDLLDAGSLSKAMQDVKTAYYLAHSMGSKGVFSEEESLCAQNFSNAAKAAGVERIIYLGGLGDATQLSKHLQSRQDVGRILRESGIPTIEFRASIIIGSGSLSYEMVRALVEKLPVMTTPVWVQHLAQPIAVEDVLQYLVEANSIRLEGSHVYEIGGPEKVSYLDLMKIYAKQRGLKRWMIPIPILSPRISSLWLGLVTPLYARVGAKLIDSLRFDTTVKDATAANVFSVKPRGVVEAFERAQKNEDAQFAATRWSDAISSSYAKPHEGTFREGSRIVDTHSIHIDSNAQTVFGVLSRMGGKNGWFYADFLWKVRGWMDMLVGGVGLRRGRRDPQRLYVGDAVDWWRVELVEEPKLIRLAAEMKLPGRAWIQFEIEPERDGVLLRQTAIFDPKGVAGLLYWHSLYPVHVVIFKGMLRSIQKKVKP